MVLLKSCKDVRYKQYIAALAGSLMYSTRIICLSWASPALSLLLKGQSPITEVTKEQASWIVSCVILGSLPGHILTGYLSEKFGRKKTMLFAAIPISIPWFIIAFSNSLYVVYAARFALGLATSICLACCIMYVGEISDEDIRGKSTTLMAIVGSCSSLYIFAIGPLLSYRIITLSCASVPLVTFFVFCFMPESPYFLAKIGRKDEAIEVIRNLASSTITEEELLMKIQKVFSSVEKKPEESSNVLELIRNKRYRKPLLLMFGIKNFTTFSGGVIISSHMQLILEESQGCVSASTASLLIGIVQLPTATLLAFTVDQIGRKPLLIFSYFGCFLSLFGEGAYFFLKNASDIDTTMISWMPSVCLILYTIVKHLGVTTVPNILLGEVFSSNIKGLAISSLTFYGGCLNFCLLKFFLPLTQIWGMHFAFFIFAFFCLGASIFIFCFLPETKKKTFADIQLKLEKDKKSTLKITHL